MSAYNKIFIFMLVSIASTLLLWGVNFKSISKIDAHSDLLYKNSILLLADLGKINNLMTDNITQLLLANSHSGAQAGAVFNHSVYIHFEAIMNNVSAITKLQNGLASQNPSFVQTKLFLDYKNSRDSFVNDGLIKTINLLEAKQYEEAKLFTASTTIPLFDKAKKSAKALMDEEARLAKIHYEDSQREYSFIQAAFAVIIFISLVIIVYIGLSIAKSISFYIETLHKREDEIHAQQAKLLAQSRSAALGEMFDNIAHQWRQPIAAINNAVIELEFSMELGDVSKESVAGTLEKINSYTAFLSNTIEDFKNFSNPSNTMTLFSVNGVIAQVIDIMHGVYSTNRIALKFAPTEDSKQAMLYGNGGEFSQVILNLLSNAKDALSEKCILQPTVEIFVSIDGGNLLISVQDNAMGIPEAVLPKIFDPYFSTKHKSQGTGIGLYMSKTIIEKHFSGTLVASNGEDGAIFAITIPLGNES